ncbi:MAG: HEAT repeat domain-containing protein [Gemmatimonadaceae bacterium]
MTDTLPTFAELCRALLAVESFIAVALASTLAVSALYSRSRKARVETRLVRGRAIMARVLAEDARAGDLESLTALPWSTRIALVLEFAPSLAGRERERLTNIGGTLGVVAHAEALCRSCVWWRRLRGARLVTALDDDSPAMRDLLRDPSSAVRAQALVWAAGRIDQDVIDELVRHLVDPERLCRFTVQDSLLRLGNPAAAALARFLASAESAGLEDGLAVARGLAHPELLSPVLALASHPSDRVRAHAIAVLGVLGGEIAVRSLGEHLLDPSPLVRAAAARATGELGYWQASSDLARLLGDSSWPVRRESALALRRLGGAGQLSLRRALKDANPFAADMARQVLDLPDPVYNRIAG